MAIRFCVCECRQGYTHGHRVEIGDDGRTVVKSDLWRGGRREPSGDSARSVAEFISSRDGMDSAVARILDGFRDKLAELDRCIVVAWAKPTHTVRLEREHPAEEPIPEGWKEERPASAYSRRILSCEVVIDPAALRAEVEGRRQFAREQRAHLIALGFSEGAANRIIRAGGPGCAVAAARWAVDWLDRLTEEAENHDLRYAARELVLTTVAGLLRPRFACPWRRMAAVLRTVGAPEDFPGGFCRLVKFLRAAEEATLAYFGREAASEGVA
jgi:hypothetical protein